MKTVAVTGATSGIGKETVLTLNASGYHIIMLNRNKEKSERMMSEFQQPHNVTMIRCDLADLNSVQQAADEVKKQFDSLDVLINNAGGIIPEREESKDGYELTFAINHLGHYLLTCALIPLLEKGKEPRIINVSSEVHAVAKPDFDDVHMTKKYRSLTAYANSKLYNIYFTQMLHEEVFPKGIAANALHPGVIRSGFGKQYSGVIGFFIQLARPFLLSPIKGSKTSIHLAVTDDGYKHSGKYFKNKKIKEPHPVAANKENRERLKELSNKCIRETLGENPPCL